MPSGRHTRTRTKSAVVSKAPPPARDALARRELSGHALAILVLWVVILAAYCNSFRAGFILDNRDMILRDPRITAATGENLHRIWNGEYWFTQSGNGLYRPLTTFSYLFNYAILGNHDRPAGYHWVNYAIHALNASLLYALGLGIFRRKTLSLALAMLWAVEPVLTESVTNVVGRADLLAGFALLAGVLCYRRSVESQGWVAWAWCSAAALAAAVGMFSKENAIIVPLIAVLYDLSFPPAGARRNRLRGYAALALPCLVYFAVRPPLSPTHFPFTDNPLVGASFWTGRLTALKVIGKYIWLLLFPVSLSSDYSYNAIPLFTWSLRSWEDWQVPLAFAACVAIAALAVYGWRHDRRWLFFIGLGALGLAPTANIARLIGTIMAERFLYVPAMGFAGCLLLSLLALSRRLRARELPVIVAVVPMVCLAYGVRTYFRNRDWFDNFSMSKSQVRTVPDSYKGHATYFGGLDDSIRHVDQALAIVAPLPDLFSTPVAYINAGTWYRDKGQTLASSAPAQSAAWYRRSLEVLLRGKAIQKAIQENRPEIDEQLGLTYIKLGDFPNAIGALEAVRRQNWSEDLIRETSSAYLQMGNPYRAEVTLWEGLLVQPENTRFAAWLVDVYARSRDSSCALQSQPGRLPVNLACPLVHEQVCAASVNMTSLYRARGEPGMAARIRDAGISEFGCPPAP